MLLALALLVLTHAQEERSAALDFTIPEGLVVSLWAESPLLFNPTALDVDARGRLWVTEAVNYRTWDGRNPGRRHESGDRVVILEDTDGDGRADSSTVFAQDAELVAPLGICVLGSDVYVSCSPSIFRYRDLDGDDAADEREVFLTGFGGFDHDHGVHSLVAHADGYLYGAVGNAGPHVVTDASGWTLRSGSLYDGGGPEGADNKPGLVSDDGRVWTGGLIFRVKPDGTGLRVMAHNFRNQYEVALDSFGNMYTADNDDDGNGGCRTLWVLPGGNYGFFSADGSRSWQADRRPGQDNPTAHWHREDPGVVPNGTINGPGGPTGVAVYEGELLARWIDGAVLNCDAGAGVVYAHRPRVEGAGIVLDPGELLRSKGDERGSRWFRPSDVVVGVDGAVYVADWFDPGVGGHAAGDGEAYGRILRIAPAGGERAEPTGIRSPAVNVRTTDLWERWMTSEFHPLSPSPRERARGLQRLAVEGEWAAVLRRVGREAEPDFRVRAAAVRSLDDRLSSWFLEQASKRRDVPFVETAVAALLGSLEEIRDDWLLRVARAFDPSDRIAVEAAGLAFRGFEADVWHLLVDELDQDQGPVDWNDRLVALAWRLHPPRAVPALAARAGTQELPIEERRRMLDALAFVPTREAAAEMHALALTGPADLRGYAAWWARDRATNDWRAFELPHELQERDIRDAERVFASDVVRSGLIDVQVALDGAETLWLVVTDAGDGNSCDWADWIEPRLVGPQGTLDLTEVGWIEAEAEWGNVHVDANAVGGALRVDATDYAGIGTHAASRIAFAVPAGYERFLARAAVDDGGSSQISGQTSVTFEVHLERPQGASRALELEERLHATSDRATLEATLRELAADAEGGMRLIRLATQGELSDFARAVVSETIFHNPDLSVRALAGEHFQRPGEEAALPPVSELLALAGDAHAGRSTFFTERAQCSRCHAVVRGGHRRGGDVGPELTAVREKLGRSELLDAILDPSVAITHGFDTWLVEDERGRLYSGFLLADGETVVLKDTDGKRHVLARDEVAGRWKQSLSTMPEGVALGLSPQEIADLLAFLTEDPDDEPVLGRMVRLFDGQSFEGWTWFLADASATRDDVWSIGDGVLVCEGDPVGYLRTEADFTNYVLELDWRFDPARGAGNSGVLLRMVGPDKVWPKSVEAQLQHRNAGDFWNIDAVDMEVDRARTSGRHTSRVRPSSEKPLGEWNHYRITVDGERITLEVNGVLQNTARWCEEVAGKICLQSEGAPIEFRDIVLWPILE